MDAPRDEPQLLARARAIGGSTLQEVADRLDLDLPDLGRSKGFIGQLVERALGARGGSHQGPDFPALGIELKTLPIEPGGRVRESTFVCGTPQPEADRLEWSSSRVRAKLTRVLFVLVEADRARPAAQRRIGAAFLWSPSASQSSLLRRDWEHLMGCLAIGDVEAVTARAGEALQLRPKGRNRTARTRAYDADGAPFLAPRRAFYLRRRFTQTILEAEGLT